MELLKQEFQNSPNFDLHQAFEVINRNNLAKNDNYISLDEFKEILRLHGIYTLDRDIVHLFNRFDKDRDGRIDFKDFANEMITVSQQKKVKHQEIIPYR